MIKLRFSVFEHRNENSKTDGNANTHPADPSHNAIWIFPSGADPTVGKTGAGRALYANGKDLSNALTNISHALRFEIRSADHTGTDNANGKPLASHDLLWPERKSVLRLDQVTFPPGAIAYRHIHSGAGFRHLLVGGLVIDTGKHQQKMRPGDSWFEGARSPVRATAMTGSVSQFIRAMLIPVDFHGKPTIRILDAEDAAQPTLQENHRFLDQIIET